MRARARSWQWVPGVTARKAGDRVGVVYFQGSCGRCEWCLRDKGFFCRDFVGTGAHTPGSHAEYMVALANTTMVIPDGVSYEQAAPIFCAGYTVWCGIRIAEAKPHETIAVVGIGGLGHLAIQYAKAAGFPTIAVTHSPDKIEMARQTWRGPGRSRRPRAEKGGRRGRDPADHQFVRGLRRGAQGHPARRPRGLDGL